MGRSEWKKIKTAALTAQLSDPRFIAIQVESNWTLIRIKMQLAQTIVSLSF